MKILKNILNIKKNRDHGTATSSVSRTIEFLSDVASNFLSVLPESLDSKISQALESIGNYLTADRVLIYSIDENLDTQKLLYKWNRAGICEMPGNLYQIPFQKFQWWTKKIYSNQTIFIERTDKISPVPEIITEFFQPGSVKSFLAYPLVPDSHLSGVLIVETVGEYREWACDEIKLMKPLAITIAGALNRKKIYAQLSDTQERFSSLIRNIPVGLFRSRPAMQSKMAMANNAAARIFGYSHVQDFLDKKVEEFYADIKDREKFLRIATRQGHVENLEVRCKRKNGSTFWASISATAIKDPDGNIEFLDGIIRDITARKKITQELEISQEWFRELLDTTREANYRINLKTNQFEYVSKSSEEIVGFTSEEMMRVTFPEIIKRIHPDDQPRILENLQNVFSKKQQPESHEIDFRFRHKDGTYHHYSNSRAFIFDPDGTASAIVGNLRDTTERKRAEDELKIMHSKLMNAREEERKHLAAELHDSIGQSLVAMRLGLQTLAVKFPDGEPQKTYRLVQLNEQCHELIQEVRHICHGLYPPALESLGLIPALRQLADYCNSGSTEAELIFNEEIENQRLGDQLEIALFRIAQEAVSNALRHGNAKHIDMELTHDNDILEMVITDDGQGFVMEKVNGKGIGLQSMRDRCRAVDGEFDVSSVPGKTKITVKVPLKL